MMFIAIKTKDGVIKGKLSFYCRMLGVSRQGFYKYLAIKDRPWKYQDLADAMRVIHAEDECNDTYGRIRMYQALLLKNPTVTIRQIMWALKMKPIQRQRWETCFDRREI